MVHEVAALPVSGRPGAASYAGSVSGIPGRFKAAVAVYALLRRDGDVLLLRRAGSGVHDGELALPAGHVDEGEDAVTALVREVAEELLVTVRPEDCSLALTGHSGPERPGDDAYVDLFFTVDRWTGEPAVGEPEKNTGLVWAAVHALPGDVVPVRRRCRPVHPRRRSPADAVALAGPAGLGPVPPAAPPAKLAPTSHPVGLLDPCAPRGQVVLRGVKWTAGDGAAVSAATRSRASPRS